MKLLAPAKINLMLHILNQRKDGYHEIQTVFQFLDFCDHLSFAHDDKIIVTCNDSQLESKDNLVYRAAKLLQKTTGYHNGVRITLEKNIPLGAGLGGGSSDAATTLLALNILWKLSLTQEQLMAIGTKLGADVPIFIYGHAAFAEGIGEKLSPIRLETPWLVLITPDCHVSTQQIFSHSQLTRDTTAITIEDFLEEDGRNDCQALVTQLYPEVQQALQWLSQHGTARMTGTGASVFCFTKDRSHADQIAALAAEDGLTAFAVKTSNVSPVKKLLGFSEKSGIIACCRSSIANTKS